MRLRKRNAASDHGLTKHCHVLLERLPESELPMLENKTAERMERKRNGEELKRHLPSTSKRRRGRPSAQTASKLEAPPKQEEIMGNKTDSKAHIPRETRHSRQGNERIKHFAASNRSQNQMPKVENETTTEISRHKGKVPIRDDRSIELENEEKPGFSMHFQKEGTKSVKSEDGQTSKSFVRFGHMSYFYVSLFKNYLYALSVNENNMNFEILERNLKKELIILNEKCENVVNKSLVKWILEISLNVKEVSLEDQWGTVKNAAMEAEREVLIECQKSKHKNKMPRKRMAQGSFYFFPPKTPQLSPSAFVEAAKPINDGASTSTKEIYTEREHFQISSIEANVNSSKTPIKSPLLEEITSTVEAIDTNQSVVPTSEREAETSINLQSNIMRPVNDIVKEVSLEDQCGIVRNAAMETEREVLIECQNSKHKNKMPRKRMAQGSLYFLPPKSPKLSPSAFVEAVEPIDDGASTSTKEIYDEREHFQISSGEENVNSSKTPIKSPLLEENTSTVEAIDTNQSEVPTSEREAETSSDLQSSIIRPVNDIVKEVSLESQCGIVGNAPMETEREVLIECQNSKHKNKMPIKRMAQGSLYSLPPKTPKLSAFVEAVKPIDDGASTCTKEIYNEREHFQISSGEENINSSKTSIKSPLLEENTSTVEAIDTNQSVVPTSEREAETSSDLQSSIMRPVNDIAPQHLEQKHNATPLPDVGCITNLLVDQVSESIETEVFVENIEKCDKIQKPSNEYYNDIDLKGDGQQKSLCTTQKLDTTSSVLETEKFLETLEEQKIKKPSIEYDNDINWEASKQQESCTVQNIASTVQNIDRTTDLVVKEALLSNEINKTRISSSECDIYLKYTEQHESLSDSEKVQKTFSPTNLVPSDKKIEENCDLSILVDAHKTSEEKQKLFLASDIEDSSLIENSISNNRSYSLYIENDKPANSSELCVSKGEEIDDAKPSHIPGEDNVIKTLLDECIQLAENQDVIPYAEHNEASVTEIEISYDVESPCSVVDLEFSQDTAEAKDSSLENVSTAGENSLYVNSSATDEEIFQLVNEVLENVVSVIETETCYDPNSVLPCSTSDIASNQNNAEGNPNISMCVNSPDEEARHLVNETLENMVSLMKTQTWDDAAFPCLVSDLESNPVYDEEERASSLTNVSTSGSASLPVNSSTDGDESLELLIIKTPENAASVAETTLCYEAPHLSSDVGSVHDTTEENRDSLPADSSTLVNSTSVDSSMDGDKLSELINNISQKVACVTETKMCFDIVSPNVTSDLESVHDTAEENDSSSPAVVPTPDERPNDNNKILFEDSTNTVSPLLSEERKEISSIENVSAGNEGICRDIMEEIIEGIENCCTDIQLNENTTFDKIPDDSSKTVSVVKEEDHELAEKDFTFMNGSDEKDEPKHHETRMFANHNKKNCDEHRSQVYEVISDGEKEEDNAWAEEEFLSSKSDLKSLTFIRPEIPEGVFILRSDCLGYLNKLRHTNDDKSGFRSDYSAYCSEDGNRIAKESKLRDLAKELKDKRRKKPTRYSAHKWANEKKNIFSWPGFDIDF